METYSQNAIDYYHQQTLNYYRHFSSSSHYENLHSVFIHFFVSLLQIISEIVLNTNQLLREMHFLTNIATYDFDINIMVLQKYCLFNRKHFTLILSSRQYKLD
eukprot:TRINITY_DN12596_c0_g1_i1.p3 TRINITY_DN12596_c0_g1~~TRINITY_DN12596_c0_g1_i1.p3  ORF type:complete len:103 (-),score=5.02 TRINITY_DN12596_c0_g1_i1:193-501(-)